ncbi:hypothetical protein [Legionella qingyii]|uniref:hypothetical protein n=1 Tax=Legionella qingyii TaxID=2184757 RepID=UPI001403DEFF|nr:hypothetical protein [Legionella qingyii]
MKQHVFQIVEENQTAGEDYVRVVSYTEIGVVIVDKQARLLDSVLQEQIGSYPTKG